MADKAPGWQAAACGWLAGSALQLQQPELLAAWVYAGLALAATVLWACAAIVPAAWRRHGGRLPAMAVLLASAVLAFSACGLRALAFGQGALDPALEGADLELTGVVAAMPQRNEAGWRFRFEVEQARRHGEAGRQVRVPPQVLLGWYGGPAAGAAAWELQRQLPELRAGERWRLTARLRAPHGNRNPHGFDYELWLWEQGLQATGYVRAGPREDPPQRLEPTWLHPVESARQQVRDAIFARVADRRQAGVLAALVVGDQNAIERADWDVFRATGVAHLMSISGLHVTMFAWAASLAVGALWRRSARLCLAAPAPTAALLGGLLLAAAYALFSGWGVPAQRTVCMLAVFGLLRLSARRWPWHQTLLLAALAVVAADPWALLQAGFWLSFVAVGVLFAADAGAAVSRTAGRVRWFGQVVLQHARQQLAITLALAPLSLLLFQQVSLVGLLANAVAIPWVTLVVTPLALLGVLWPAAWAVAAWAVAQLAALLQWMAGWPVGLLSAAAPPLWAAAAGLAGGGLLAMRLPWGARALGLALLLPVLLWQAPRPAPGQFELIAADVGQGNAVLVRTARHALVYDSGPRISRESDAGHRVLVPLLRALDERVDTLVLSHRDSDHTGGAAAVLAMQPRAALLASIEEGHELQALRPATRCVAGQRWEWDGVRFEVLHPQPQDYAVATAPNALSCVLRIRAGEGPAAPTALLAGDIEQPQEAALLKWQADLRADLLLAPHHGSKTSSSAPFLDAVRPSLAVVQAGYRNRFGHPAAEVLERYRERGSRVVASPACGAAHWHSQRPQEVSCEREAAQRYWQHQLP